MKCKYSALAVLAGTLLGFASVSQAAATLATPRVIQVTAKRFAFEPAEITVEQGEPVVLELKSADVAHGLRIRELNLDVKVGKGATIQAAFTPQALGDFVGHCSVFCGSGHGQMTLTIHVVKRH
ncbi:MAG: cupredoxin domain-containing protein [Terracidiphilus sp.]|jgi:cytochrome c oxidase subunit 2